MTDTSESRAAGGVPGGLGGRLRQVRTARGFSVRELARRAGCSASLVSQVERGVTAPSAGVVYALAHQLGISIDSLFGGDDVEPGELPHLPGVAPPYRVDPPWGRATGADGAGIVQRAGDRNTIELSTGVRWERLTPTHDNRVDLIEIVYQPGGQSSENGRAVRHDGREYLYVLEGELEAVVGFETLQLMEGDSLAFDPATPHHYRNATNKVVRALSVVVRDPSI
ncbi:XRE family transcriptional regulator [Mycobacterium sp.]|uniref:helix-turn-helix domain-containing protein n=1 Tax=Mycobacterium sp. TaxID=1785 RepID=UPI002BAF8C2F|nr:XRE family transcriptional regulator [Mycobacterium sp.]HTQ15989.1 XRE family transcriptional regulator [Mycobacterium sp.]